jgi:hypothetical protein
VVRREAGEFGGRAGPEQCPASNFSRYRPPDVLLGSVDYFGDIDMWWVYRQQEEDNIST